jgi:hypothetical protein
MKGKPSSISDITSILELCIMPLGFQTLLLFWSYAPWISDITSILELCPCLLYTVAGITGIHVLWAHSISIEIIGFIVKRHTS